MRRTALAAALLCLVLSACGAAPSQESKFTGDRAEIAQLIDELAAAGRAKDAEKICTEILAKELVDELKAADGDCVAEMERAINDANDYDLQVVDVKVTGSTATATVRQGESKNTAVFAFVKLKDGTWRASALGA